MPRLSDDQWTALRDAVSEAEQEIPVRRQDAEEDAAEGLARAAEKLATAVDDLSDEEIAELARQEVFRAMWRRRKRNQRHPTDYLGDLDPGHACQGDPTAGLEVIELEAAIERILTPEEQEVFAPLLDDLECAGQVAAEVGRAGDDVEVLLDSARRRLTPWLRVLLAIVCTVVVSLPVIDIFLRGLVGGIDPRPTEPTKPGPVIEWPVPREGTPPRSPSIPSPTGRVQERSVPPSASACPDDPGLFDRLLSTCDSEVLLPPDSLPSLPTCLTRQVNGQADDQVVSGRRHGLLAGKARVESHYRESAGSEGAVAFLDEYVELSQPFEYQGSRGLPPLSVAAIISPAGPNLSDTMSTVYFFGWEWHPARPFGSLVLNRLVPLHACEGGEMSSRLPAGQYKIWIVPFGVEMLDDLVVLTDDSRAAVIDLRPPSCVAASPASSSTTCLMKP